VKGSASFGTLATRLRTVSLLSTQSPARSSRMGCLRVPFLRRCFQPREFMRIRTARRTSVVALSLLAFVVDAHSASQPRTGSFDPGLNLLLEANDGRPIFVSACSSNEAEKAVLMIFASSDSGLLIQYRSGTVVNLAQYTFSAGLSADLESHGGAATREVVAALIKQLESMEFRLLRSPSAERLRLLSPSMKCGE